MKIVSQAQHALMQRCVSDPDYARSRGISPAVAQEMLDAHKAAGGGDLPERAAQPASPAKSKPKPVKGLLGQ